MHLVFVEWDSELLLDCLMRCAVAGSVHLSAKRSNTLSSSRYTQFLAVRKNGKKAKKRLKAEKRHRNVLAYSAERSDLTASLESSKWRESTTGYACFH